MHRRPTHTERIVIVLAALAACSCGGGTAPPPGPGTVRGTPPDLRGRRIVVLPVQRSYGISGDADAELAFGLRDRTRDVVWVLASEVEAALARSPAVQARTRGLPVSHFLAAEVQRVGDPLYGELRRISALVEAELILIPVQAALTREPGEDPRITLTTTLIEPRTGRVLWFSVLQGGPFPEGDPRALASAVEEMARTLLWYVVEQ